MCCSLLYRRWQLPRRRTPVRSGFRRASSRSSWISCWAVMAGRCGLMHAHTHTQTHSHHNTHKRAHAQVARTSLDGPVMFYSLSLSRSHYQPPPSPNPHQPLNLPTSLRRAFRLLSMSRIVHHHCTTIFTASFFRRICASVDFPVTIAVNSIHSILLRSIEFPVFLRTTVPQPTLTMTADDGIEKYARRGYVRVLLCTTLCSTVYYFLPLCVLLCTVYSALLPRPCTAVDDCLTFYLFVYCCLLCTVLCTVYCTLYCVLYCVLYCFHSALPSAPHYIRLCTT
jgi:hypothetical protein